MKSWINNELAGCEFKDVRLGKRFRNLIERMSKGIGNSIPLACQDWACTKAAYRFLSNTAVSTKSCYLEDTFKQHVSVLQLPMGLSWCCKIQRSFLMSASSHN